MGVIVIALPLCCLDEVVQVRLVFGVLNGRFFEFTNCKRGEGPIIFEAVCEMLGDGLDVEVEGRCRFGSPRVVKNVMFETLSRYCECWFLWSKSAMLKTLLSPFNFGFLFGLRCWGG
jgi:hypothetical protein